MSFKTLVNKYLTIFILPVLVAIYGFILARTTHDWAALAYAVYVFISVMAIVFAGIFLVINRYWFKLRLNWWKNLLFSIGLWFLAMALFIIIVRAGK